MTLKLFIILTTCVLLANGGDVQRKENAESYITKEAAKELRSKLSVRGELRDQDYDDILRRIIVSAQHPTSDDIAERIVYEKKYFDYLPNDLDSEDVTEESLELRKQLDDVLSVEHEAPRDNGRRVNSRKFKRDTAEASRKKRQDFYFPAASSVVTRWDAPPSNSFAPINTNPFHPNNNPNRFHPPGNLYLPALRPGKNPPSPPHNPQNPNVDIGNRIPLFEEDDSIQRVWGTNTVRTTPRPQPIITTTPRRPVSVNSIDNSNDEPELEIEYPPDTFEGPLTTRAPLKRPTINRNVKNPNRKVTTQKNQVLTSTPEPPTTRANRTSNGRKQSQTLPACVQAIVNCCSRYDEVVRTPCFEKYNCSGRFFGRSPCSAEIKSAAFREVEKFTQS